MKKLIDQKLEYFIENVLGMGGSGEQYLRMIILLIFVSAFCYLIWVIARHVFTITIRRVTKVTKTMWDDQLVRHRFFRRLARIIPAIIFYLSTPYIFRDFLQVEPYVERLFLAFIIWAFMQAINAFLNTTTYILYRKPEMQDKPITSYAQTGKIINYFIGFIFIFSIITQKDPIYFLSAMGAMTAILILIFKDTILGFVASIQMSANDMVRIGDWVTIEKYGADGTVQSINLTSVKLQNFDKTISTIPTYAFISDSFKNWRGMEEANGRRIKRSILIDMNTVHFCDDKLLQRLERIDLIREYIVEKAQEIKNHNINQGVNQESWVNGRNLTNIGIFRVYLENYLKNNKDINQRMTLMVRQLAPTSEGIPLELYAFISKKEWAIYEGIVANIFDHIMASAPEFELAIFQNPSGKDFVKLNT